MLNRAYALTLGALGVLVAAGAVFSSAYAADDAHLVELTQTPCQFVEVEEGGDHGFQSSSKADCDAINAQSGEERLAASTTLVLAPGDYVFRVTNANVSYPLGFWLREDGYDTAGTLERLTMTSVSGGGLTTGTSKDYEVELAPGSYVYSCPLNPTLNYRILVEE